MKIGSTYIALDTKCSYWRTDIVGCKFVVLDKHGSYYNCEILERTFADRQVHVEEYYEGELTCRLDDVEQVKLLLDEYSETR